MFSKKKILIENCAGIGDAIMFTPMLREFKKKYPDCILSFITKKLNVDLLQELPYIDTVYSMDNSLKELQMIPVMRKQDYVIFTCTQPRLLRIAPFLHIPHVFSAYKEKYEKKKLAHKWIRSWVLDSPQFAAQTITDRFNELLGTDMEITYQCDVAIPHISDSNKNLLNLMDGINDSYALIAPVSSRPERDIPIPVLNKVLDHLTEKKRMTCVILGDTERSGIIQNDKIRNLLGKTNIKEAIKLIEMSKMVFCTDSGPMHIAGALKKPTVALFTRDIASRWAPKTYCHPVSIHMPCSPCRNETATACQHHDCMKKIPLEMILQALDNVFAEC